MRVQGKSARAVSGFTMIELILVMFLLTAVIAFAAPRLAAFFRGRALDSEARRLLALTRYAQDRAASEGIPIRMWFDNRTGTYGVEPDPTFVESSTGNLEFTLPQGMELQARRLDSGRRQLQASHDSASVRPDPKSNLPMIRFVPEGAIEPETILEVTLTDNDGFSLTITPARTRMHFEIVGGTGR